jgi:hypothetical protein
MLLALASACDSQRANATPRATAASFADHKEARLLGVHVERGLLAAQPGVISTFADQLVMADDARAAIDDKLRVVEQRLVDADSSITALETATPDTWPARDAATTTAMRRLEAARDDAWEAVKAAHRAERRVM